MNYKNVRALLIVEAFLVGGVLIHHHKTHQPVFLTKPIVKAEVTIPELVSPIGLKSSTIEEYNKLQEQKRIEEENRLKQQQEEERVRLLKAEEERKRRESPHFNPYNVSELSNLSKEQISIMLEGTALHTLVNAYYWYEQQYQINAIFLMALTAEESGWGRSYLAINNNNLSGHKNSKGDWSYYNNWGECLEESFRLLSQEYVDPEGLFYTGASLYDINLVYCPDPENPNSWANNISRIGYELLAKLEGGK